MQEVTRLFTEQSGIPVRVSSGSSGVLSAQIRQGAPFDLFMSANMVYPRALYDEGLAVTKPKIYAYGTLVMWVLDNTDIQAGLSALSSRKVARFAVANSQTAPYGIAAMQVLERSGVLPLVEEKMVVGESVGQVNQYVASGAVQVALTSSSVLHTGALKDTGRAIEINRDLYDPIRQAVVILRDGMNNNAEQAILFQEFMFTEQVQSLLDSHGYLLLEGVE